MASTLRNTLRYLWLLCLPLLLIPAGCIGGKNNRVAEAREMADKGQMQYDSGDYNGALDTFHGFINTFDPKRDSVEAFDYTRAYFFLGNIYLAYNDYAQAGEYYKSAYSKSLESGRNDIQMRILFNQAAVQINIGDSTRTAQLMDRLATVDTKDTVTRAYYLHMLDAVYHKHFRDLDASVPRLKRLLAYADSNHMNSRWKLTPLAQLTEYYCENGPSDSAFRYLGMYDRLAGEYSVSNMMIECMRRYTRLYAAQGDLTQVIRYQDRYDALIDSLMEPSRFISLNSKYTNTVRRESERKIQSLTMTVSVLHVVLIIIAVVTLFLTLTLVYRHKFHNATVQLFRRNREIVEIEEQNAMNTARDTTDHDAIQDNSGQSDDDRKEFNSSALYRRIVEFMKTSEEYLNPDFNLSILAERVGSNTRYVSQAINDTDSNFRNFINEYRIREARRRLLDVDRYGSWTIQSIAQSVGFLSTSTFNAAFKKFTGMTPTVYQRMSQSDKQNG